MIKKSTSLHKIPYFDLLTKTLTSVDKDKAEYHDIMCVCPSTVTNCAVEGRPEQGGYKFQFNYSIEPTMEPISYLLKGYTWNASLSYSDIDQPIKDDVIIEINKYMHFIYDTYFEPLNYINIKPIVLNFNDYAQNEHDNWSLSNKIFQRIKRFEWRGEEYDPFGHLPMVCMGVNIESNTYLVAAKFTIIQQHTLNT